MKFLSSANQSSIGLIQKLRISKKTRLITSPPEAPASIISVPETSTLVTRNLETIMPRLKDWSLPPKLNEMLNANPPNPLR